MVSSLPVGYMSDIQMGIILLVMVLILAVFWRGP
jgi:hypothetical protein